MTLPKPFACNSNFILNQNILSILYFDFTKKFSVFINLFCFELFPFSIQSKDLYLIGKYLF